MDGVAWVEEASLYYIAANPGPRNITVTGLYGLDQIDSTTGVRNNVYDPPANGAGVDIYVIDTGINPAHTNFVTGGATRISFRGAAANFVTDPSRPAGSPAFTDCNGHGTHVAGTAASNTYGVAAGARVIPVRVFTCAGSTTNAAIINGINYVINQAAANPTRRAVVNMSLGGGISTTLDQAVNRMANANIFVAVAAGNENQNAANTSPARAPGAFAVGASTNADARATFSNFGTSVKIFAPGQGILSTWWNNPQTGQLSNTGTNTISGTSMASPHVAGAAALLRERFPTLTVGGVGNRLIQDATLNVVTGVNGSPNRLLNVNRP
jgi:subtilisin family serine protease